MFFRSDPCRRQRYASQDGALPTKIRSTSFIKNLKKGFSILWVSTCTTLAMAAPGTISFDYDQAGRLIQKTHHDTTTVDYTLDAAGNRVAVAASGPSAPQSGGKALLGVSGGEVLDIGGSDDLLSSGGGN